METFTSNLSYEWQSNPAAKYQSREHYLFHCLKTENILAFDIVYDVAFNGWSVFT